MFLPWFYLRGLRAARALNCFSFNNPMKYIDKDGLTPLYIFQQGKEGHYTISKQSRGE